MQTCTCPRCSPWLCFPCFVGTAFQAPRRRRDVLRERLPRRRPIGCNYAAKPLPAEVVFENINFFGFVKRLTAAVAHQGPRRSRRSRRPCPPTTLLLSSAFIFAGPRAEADVAYPLEAVFWGLVVRDLKTGPETPQQRLRLSIYGLDVLYCTSCLVGNPLPNVIPAVAAGIGYTAVAGTLCTSIKDRFLERQVLPAWSKDTRARNFAVKRGTGIGIWILCILICLETLRIEAGVSVKSIIGLTSIFGIATGFAVKDLASNWVGGLLLFVTRPFVPGDKIEMTRLKQSRGTHRCIVPNSKFVSNNQHFTARSTPSTQAFSFDDEDLLKCAAIVTAPRQVHAHDLVKNYRVYSELDDYPPRHRRECSMA